MIRFDIVHLPTAFLVIGWPLFWLEMLGHPGPHTSIAAWLLWGALVVWTGFKHRSILESSSPEDLPAPHALLYSFLTVGALILLAAFLASWLAPHLPQESDVLNYHYSLPRQHLIRGSWAWMPWSSVDLWLMPVQYALAPFWFATPLPNKIPQFFFLIGLLAVTARLAQRRSGSTLAGLLAAAAVVGSHGFGIQMGSAMLDIPLTYLALAAIDSWCSGRRGLALIEFSFWAWSKPFMPLQAALVLIGIWGLGRLLLPLGWHLTSFPAIFTKKTLLTLVFLSSLIAGPFWLRSWKAAGTPLYPFMPYAMGHRAEQNPSQALDLAKTAAITRNVRETYGEGRTTTAFLRHFWRMAVPDRGVNNAFDYPIGLPYLLCLVPFVSLLVLMVRRRTLDAGLLAIVFLWTLWWFSSQQSRWLYLPLTGIFIVVLSEERFRLNRFLQAGLLLGGLLTGLSVWRAHRADLSHWPATTLRPWDQRLLDLTRGDPRDKEIEVDQKEIAYAEAPVVVRGRDHFYILDARVRTPSDELK